MKYASMNNFDSFSRSFFWNLTWIRFDGYAMLMSPDKGETALFDCPFPKDMAVRMS